MEAERVWIFLILVALLSKRLLEEEKMILEVAQALQLSFLFQVQNSNY